MAIKGKIFDIQRFSVHDGPGIRSIVFFKGCSLRCKWCANPEGWRIAPDLLHVNDRCRACGECAKICPKGAIIMEPEWRWLPPLCDGCGLCEEVCVFDAARLKGREAGVAEIMAELEKDAAQYNESGGGVTLSGGEALLQAEFAALLLKNSREKGWSTAVETTANVPWGNFLKVLPWLEHVLLDIKHADSGKHRFFTGVPNERILENAKRLGNISHLRLVVRIPVIPGFNDTEEELRAIARIAAAISNVTALHLLPYHRLGENKYGYMGKKYPMEGISPLSGTRMEELRDSTQNEIPFDCLIGG